MNAITYAFLGDRTRRILITISRRDSQGIRILFDDNGTGIALEHVGKVLDPFFTTRRAQGGTGLGLHIVYDLVTGVLGGDVGVTSEVGRATRFRIDLPFSPAEASVPPTGVFAEVD